MKSKADELNGTLDMTLFHLEQAADEADRQKGVHTYQMTEIYTFLQEASEEASLLSEFSKDFGHVQDSITRLSRMKPGHWSQNGGLHIRALVEMLKYYVNNI